MFKRNKYLVRLWSTSGECLQKIVVEAFTADRAKTMAISSTNTRYANITAEKVKV